MKRLKTGTPPRAHTNSITWNKLEVASGEDFVKENPDEIWVTFYDVEGELLEELLPEFQEFEYSNELKKYKHERTICM